MRMFKYKEFLNESTKNNHSIDSDELYHKIKDLDIIKYTDRPSGRFKQSIDIQLHDSNDIDTLESILHKHNWYIAVRRNNNLEISKKYIKEAEVDMPNELYHITPRRNISAIYRDGLKSKSEFIGHRFPNRIYLSDNIESLVLLKRELIRYREPEQYSIVKLDTSNLNTKLYKDLTSAYKGHYYIQEIDIAPSLIIEVIEID